MQSWIRSSFLAVVVLACVLAAGRPFLALGATNTEIYSDALNSGWANWSWGTNADFSNGSPVYSGTTSLAATYTTAWGGLYLHSSAATSQSTFYLDAISLIAAGGVPTSLQGPYLHVDVNAQRRLISPYIYGMNFADENLASELRLPVRRWGGNSTSRYNWQNDFTNVASDWYYENISLAGMSSADTFVDQNKRTGTSSLITLPMMGWVAKDSPVNHPFACGFKVTKYGVQQRQDAWDPDCGNGYAVNGAAITNNDPLDTSIAITTTFIQQWITHFKTKYGASQNGGIQFYNLDNEPNLWNSTQRDVHPTPLGYDELLSRTVRYASAVKTADPNALVLAPAEWGWTNYFYSAKDEATGGNWTTVPLDRNAHGGIRLMDWYLQQMKANDQLLGKRTLDYFDLHYYPQANNVALKDVVDAGTQALRLRTTRSLWDPSYVDESWINGTDGGPQVRLIPRMHDWVNNNYPGTKIAIGEYNWGAIGYLNGALAQADVLGIFGREALDLATMWAPPTTLQPTAYAFRIYRNYDGAGTGFGETSVQASSTDQDRLAIYAAIRSIDQALTLVVINKTPTDLTSTVSLANFSPSGPAFVYRYSGANLNAILREADQTLTPGGFAAAFPASSITLFVLHIAIPSVGLKAYVPLVYR